MANTKVKKTTRRHHLLLLLLFLATIFMGIGYASLSVLLTIDGSATVLPKESVHISIANYSSNNGADLNNSNINDFFGTTLNSTITLGSNQNSTITYTITITNETSNDYMFIGTSYDAPDFYDNLEITYDITNMNVGYRLNSGTSKTFDITFRYVGSNTSNHTLNSYISFDFGIAHDITYAHIANASGYPSYVIDGDTLTVTFTNDVPYDLKITKSDNSVLPTTSYTYVVDPNNSNNKILTIPNVDDDLSIDRYYSLAYILNNGTNNSNNPDKFLAGTTLSILDATNSHDGTFDGWYQNSGLTGTSISSTSQLTGDTTLYAKWISSITNMNFNTTNNRFESTNVSDLKLSDFRSYQYTQNSANTTINSITLYVTYNSSNKTATLNCQVASNQTGFSTVQGTISIARSQSNATASTTFTLNTPIQPGSNYTISCPSYSGDNNGKVKLNGVSLMINP